MKRWKPFLMTAWIILATAGLIWLAAVYEDPHAVCEEFSTAEDCK